MTVDAAPRRRRGRLAWILVPLLLLIVLAVVAVVLVETVGRGIAEKYVEDRVESSLPAGVTGDVSVRLGGGSLIAQYLSGRMEDVRLVSDDLAVQGIPVRARLQLAGAPIDQTRPVESARGSVVLGEDAVEALLAQQGYPGNARLANGLVEYSDTTQVLGADLDYTITARPSLSGGVLQLAPESARLSSGGLDIDADRLLRLVAPDGISLCLAEAVPQALTLDSLDVGDGSARLDFSGRDVVLTADALARTGSCG